MLLFFCIKTKSDYYNDYYGDSKHHSISNTNSSVFLNEKKNYFILNCRFINSNQPISANDITHCNIIHAKCIFSKCGQCVKINKPNHVVQLTFCANECKADTGQDTHFTHIAGGSSDSTKNYIIEGSIAQCSKNYNYFYPIQLMYGEVKIQKSNISFCAATCSPYFITSQSVINVSFSVFGNNTCAKEHYNFYSAGGIIYSYNNAIGNNDSKDMCELKYALEFGSLNNVTILYSNFIQNGKKLVFKKAAGMKIVVRSCYIDPQEVYNNDVTMETIDSKLDFEKLYFDCLHEEKSSFKTGIPYLMNKFRRQVMLRSRTT